MKVNCMSAYEVATASSGQSAVALYTLNVARVVSIIRFSDTMRSNATEGGSMVMVSMTVPWHRDSRKSQNDSNVVAGRKKSCNPGVHNGNDDVRLSSALMRKLPENTPPHSLSVRRNELGMSVKLAKTLSRHTDRPRSAIGGPTGRRA